MRQLKKIISVLLPILVVAAWYIFTPSPSPPKTINIVGARENIRLFEEPDAGEQPIVDAINSAQKQILIEVYLLSDKAVIQALETAESRGIDVKVMLEQHPVGGSSLNQKSKAELDSDGIATEWSDPSFTLTHEKGMVIDGSVAFILSQNLSASSFTKNREHDVEDTNPVDVQEVSDIFTDDWDRQSFTPTTSNNIIESPDNSRTILTSLINSSTQSIDAETEDINDPQLISLLSNKAKTLKVRLLTPTLKQISSNQTALAELASAGVMVRTISSPYMHAKMIVSDNNRAYVGSINFSTQSMDKNRELGIILIQPDSLQTLKSDFEQDWSKATQFQSTN